MSEPPHATSHDEITITEGGGEWHVCVRSGDKVERRSFVKEEFAEAFAEGQRLRLGLSKM